MSEAIPTPADIAPSKGEPAQAAPTWEQVFEGQDPVKVKEALDNSRKWEARAKENKSAADELTQLKQSQMTELERAQSDVESLRKQLDEAPKRVAADLRSTLADAFGIGEEDATLYLTSDDPKTLLQQALGLSRRNATSPTPKPDLSQGGGGGAPALNSDGLEEALRAKLGI